MMARSTTRSNLRPDTLMQDRLPPDRRNHLQRTAGPYIRVTSVALCARRPRVDFRNASLATELAPQCNMSFRARSLHQAAPAKPRFRLCAFQLQVRDWL